MHNSDGDEQQFDPSVGVLGWISTTAVRFTTLTAAKVQSTTRNIGYLTSVLISTRNEPEVPTLHRSYQECSIWGLFRTITIIKIVLVLVVVVVEQFKLRLPSEEEHQQQ